MNAALFLGAHFSLMMHGNADEEASARCVAPLKKMFTEKRGCGIIGMRKRAWLQSAGSDKSAGSDNSGMRGLCSGRGCGGAGKAMRAIDFCRREPLAESSFCMCDLSAEQFVSALMFYPRGRACRRSVFCN